MVWNPHTPPPYPLTLASPLLPQVPFHVAVTLPSRLELLLIRIFDFCLDFSLSLFSNSFLFSFFSIHFEYVYVRTESLLTLCNRHPANIPALITEIEWKLEQDTYLVSCIQDKLWEHAMEKQTYLDTFKHLKSLIKEGAESHNKLLEYRYSVKKSLATQGIEDQKKLLALQNGAQTPIRARKVDQSRGAIQTLEVGTMGNSEVSLCTAVLALCPCSCSCLQHHPTARTPLSSQFLPFDASSVRYLSDTSPAHCSLFLSSFSLHYLADELFE
jgi:hypothetical protein